MSAEWGSRSGRADRAPSQPVEFHRHPPALPGPELNEPGDQYLDELGIDMGSTIDLHFDDPVA